MQEHLVVHTSQKTEHLLTFLLGNIREPISPFSKHTILVANSGMQRYLELHIAKALGICSHVNLTYLGSFLWQCQQAVLNDISADTDKNKVTNPRALSYLIYSYLNEYLAVKNSDKILNQALSGLANAAQRFHFAEQIAELFIRYSEQRPQIFTSWQANRAYSKHPHEPWQHLIYQDLNFASLLHLDNKAFLNHCQQQCVTDSDKIHVFGFHHLSPTHLAELLAISNHTPVYFYALNPSQEYWFDSLDAKQLAKQPALAQLSLFADKDANDTPTNNDDNPLLASWGKAGKYLLSELSDFDPIFFEQLKPNHKPAKHLLAAVQYAIFKLKYRADTTSIDLAEDNSFVINSAASPRREIEVLHDHLLDLLNNRDIAAADIIVMMPNLSDYSEHIHSVFAGASHASDNYQLIPYTIANQSSSEQSPDCKLLLHLLQLIANDFTATDFFEFCHLTALRERYALDDATLKTIRRWVSDSKTSWGLSQDFRKHFGLVATQEEQGHFAKLTERLFYEYTTGEIADNPLTPLFHGQKNSLETLAGLISQLKLFEKIKFQSKTLADWKKTLRQMCTVFLPLKQSMSDAEQLIDDWHEQSTTLLNEQETIPFAVIQRDISELLTHHELRGPFLGGGVSFCVMQPMRAIPAKVICLLGMNENYPTYKPRLEFDLQSVKPQLSDKNSSDESKYLFLESLLSATEQFYISYIGIDNQSAKDIAPSVMVQTLSNYLLQIDKSFGERIQHKTQIHGFSRKLFPDKTYSTLYQAPKDKAAIDMVKPETVSAPLFFAIGTLAKYLESPLDCYLQAHYQLKKPHMDEPLNSHDFIGLNDGKGNWQFKNAYLQSKATLAHPYSNDLNKLLITENMLAPPPLDKVVETQTEAILESYLTQLSECTIARQESEGLLQINGTTLFHPPLYFSENQQGLTHRLFLAKNGKTKALIEAVLLHLIATNKLQNDCPEGITGQCVFFDKTIQLSAIPNPDYYWQIIFDYLNHIYNTPSTFQLNWKLLKRKNEIECNSQFLNASTYTSQNQSEQLYFNLAKRFLAEQTKVTTETTNSATTQPFIDALPTLVTLIS